MKKILLLLVALYCMPLFSQEKSIAITWGSSQKYTADSYSITVPTFSPAKNFSFDLSNGIQYVQQWKVNGFVNQNSLVVNDVVYAPMPINQMFDLDFLLRMFVTFVL